MEATATVGVVVPTRGRPERLGRLLEALTRQVRPPDHVVVVVDGPDASTEAVLHRHAGPLPLTWVVRQRSGGPGPARNVGWRATETDVVAFVDDDCVPAPDWLRAVTAPIAAGDADVVQGRTVPAGAPLPRDGWERQISIPAPSGKFETCNIAYRRTVLADTDGFDERFRRAGEDADLGLRALAAGARFRFADDAVVEHDRVRETFAQVLRSCTRAVDLPDLVARHPRLRDDVFARVFWDRRHATTVALGGAAALAGRRHGVAAAAVLAGWLWRRSRRYPDAAPGRRTVLAAGSVVADAWEVACTARGAVRARSLLL